MRNTQDDLTTDVGRYRDDKASPPPSGGRTLEARRRRGISEPFSAISHMVGAALSIAALVVLVVLAHGRPWQVVSFAIYGSTLILLYTASALHHSIRHVEGLERLDHAMIYLLIAGSYTPICLIILRGGWGWSIFGVEWGLAITGTCLSLSLKLVPDAIRLGLYIAMGWLITIAIVPLRGILTEAEWHWLIAGGVTYTLGAVVFATNWPHIAPGKFHAHDLWHCMVLGGSYCHFMMMLLFVISKR
ncbi:MAG: PAQR family membrane homeostasis protein TrhA [Capsulimonadaceae bacterium]